MQNYITKKEKINYCVGLSGQNLVYSLVGASFFTYFMTDIAMFPAIIVSARQRKACSGFVLLIL